MIRNYNLNFDADNYIVNLYPCYPEIYAKKQNHIFEVSNRYPVLIMNFIKKDRVILHLFILGILECLGAEKNYVFQV